MVKTETHIYKSIDPEHWVSQYGDALYRYARYRLRDSPMAEDVVQETFVAALKAQQNFANQSAELTWLMGILKNKIVDQYRRMSSNPEIQQQDEMDDGWAGSYFHQSGFNQKGTWKTGPSKQFVPGAGMEHDEFRRALSHCLDGLPQRAMMTFVLKEIDHVATQQICTLMNLSRANYWAIMHRARMQLRQCLEIQGLGVA